MAPRLEGARVTLRAPIAADKAEWLQIGRDSEFVRLVGGDPRELRDLTVDDVERQYAALAAEAYGWAIEYRERFIGTARLHSLDPEHRRARYAVGIRRRDHWGRGLGTEVTRLVLAFGFDDLGLHRVDLRVLEENTRAISCYENCGFVVEGREREGAFIAGEWKTDLVMSILEPEYRQQSWAARAP